MEKTKKENQTLHMSNSEKEKYAELFMSRLDTMEAKAYQLPWVSPRNGSPCNVYRRNKPYRKSNAFFLTMLCEDRGYETPFFLTKTQLKNEDGNLRFKGLQVNSELLLDENGLPAIDDKGMPQMTFEKRFPVVYYMKRYKDKDGNKISEDEYYALSAEEQQECRSWWFQDVYLVYNLDQTNFKELYPEVYAEMTKVPEHDYKQGERDEVLDAMILGGKWRCPILIGGHSSHYSPSDDHIRLPKREAFLGDEKFYSAAIHEMAHSTAKELGRKGGSLFATEGYALEEFVAELTAACVCSRLGIGKLLDDNHMAYVQGWRRALREDKNVIPLVIDNVQKASNYIFDRYEQVRKELHPLALPLAA